MDDSNLSNLVAVFRNEAGQWVAVWNPFHAGGANIGIIAGFGDSGSAALTDLAANIERQELDALFDEDEEPPDWAVNDDGDEGEEDEEEEVGGKADEDEGKKAEGPEEVGQGSDESAE